MNQTVKRWDAVEPRPQSVLGVVSTGAVGWAWVVIRSLKILPPLTCVQCLFKLVNLAIVFLANIVIVVLAILAVLTITRYFLLQEETLMFDAIDIELLIVRRYVVPAFPTSLFMVAE